jgi:hypothetical protein
MRKPTSSRTFRIKPTALCTPARQARLHESEDAMD